MTLNTMKAVGKNLRDILSTRLAKCLPSRAAVVVPANANAAALDVDDTRGLLVATPSVLPPPAIPTIQYDTIFVYYELTKRSSTRKIKCR